MDTERDAVYLMCEIRKLLDYADRAHKPTALRMYCHWALHVDLNRPGTTEPFVKRIDDVISKFMAGPLTVEQVTLQHALVAELGFFERFRLDLRDCFRQHNLPTDLCDDDNRWFAFLEAYMGVIEDGSLLCNLNNIQGVSFTKATATMTPNDLPFALKWVVWLQQPSKEGKYTVEIRAERSRGTYCWSFGAA
jgi:hypothetical protein